MSTRARNVLGLALTLSLGGALLAAASRTAREPELFATPLAAVPSGAAGLLAVDLRRLARTPALAGLIPGVGGRAGRDVASLCGFDPLLEVRALVLAMPGGLLEGEWGLSASGPFVASRLAGCASKVIAARGGRPVVLQEGEFLVVTDVGSAGSGILAVRSGGALLLGGDGYVHQMMAASARRAPSVLVDARHAALRAEVGEREPLVLSVLLSAGSRDRVRQELGDARAPAVSVLGVGLSVSEGEPARLHAMLGCDRPEPCAELARTLSSLRGGAAGGLLGQVPGLRASLDAAVVTADGPTVHVRLSLSSLALGALGRLGLSALGLGGAE